MASRRSTTRGRKKRPSLEEELAALPSDPTEEGGRERIRVALERGRAAVASRAAELIRDAKVDEFSEDLVRAYERFEVDGAKTDPGCLAKTAILEALDHTDHMLSEPFARATRYVQFEKAYPKSEDRADRLRARAILALSRLSIPEVLLYAGPMLADPAVPVRLATATAIAHFGSRDGAALLALKIRVGDSDPTVITESMTGLLQLAPDFGVPILEALLLHGEPVQRELSALALGQSPRPEALEALLRWLEQAVTGAERNEAILALGFHRSDRALDALLSLLRSETTADAEAAVRTLAIRRFEPGVEAQVVAIIEEHEDRMVLEGIRDEHWR
ncbi:MAG: HEAT repeat domain-containing protein [Myxococcota bacterium]